MQSLKTWQKLLAEAPAVDGIALMDLLDYPQPLRLLLQQLMRRRRVTADTFADLLDVSLSDLSTLVPLFTSKGYIQTTHHPASGDPLYRVNLSHIRGREPFKDLLFDDEFDSRDS